ncbi:MAG: serine/threonine protein kinase, partial [Myxococcaceae bacterium]|nr:serine/threonine protein kinase [Myxococcaceae bacterium]
MQTLGRYQLIKKLATGGMAEVFLASAEGPGGFSKQLVVKRILPHFADNPQFVQMFLSEAKLAAQLNHPNIVQVFDFGQAGRDYFLAMEFVEGMNLRSLNRMYRMQAGSIPMPLCARMISQACEGLSYAHTFRDPKTNKPVNLVHRDISPDNLIISKHGAVKVLDFGIAKAETQVHKTTTGMLKGKMAYMPPEQLQREPLDMRVDVYALGVVLFELIAGSMPFDATSEVSIIQAVMKPDPMPPLSQLVANVPPQLEHVVAKALAKSKEHRYQDCKELQADLESYIQASGEKCLPSDLAQLVEVAEAGHREETRKSLVSVPDPSGGGDEQLAASTFISPSGDRPITGVSNTHLKAVPEAAPAKGGAPKGAIIAALGLFVVAGALSAYVVVGPGATGGKDNAPIVVPPPPPHVDPPVVAVVDAGAAVAAGVAEPEVDAGVVAEAPTPTPTPTP